MLLLLSVSAPGAGNGLVTYKRPNLEVTLAMIHSSDIQPDRELEQLEKRMERRWYDLAMAEQRGQPTRVLEKMYDAYLRALDAYIAYQRQKGGKTNPGSRLAS
jgi:hypothetical protein